MSKRDGVMLKLLGRTLFYFCIIIFLPTSMVMVFLTSLWLAENHPNIGLAILLLSVLALAGFGAYQDRE